MISAEEMLKRLKARARSENIEGMARYGMSTERRLGVPVPDMRRLAKEAGRRHALALDLWKTGIPEAMIVASMVDEPEKLSETQMEDWVRGIDSWDVCDQVCMNLFEKSPLAWKKILDWSRREEQFVKRAAFALIACLAWHDRQAEDRRFIPLFPVIARESVDERNFVKKAVSWALRNIGKRNPRLKARAIEAAREIGRIDSRSARWIATTAIRDLER